MENGIYFSENSRQRSSNLIIIADLIGSTVLTLSHKWKKNIFQSTSFPERLPTLWKKKNTGVKKICSGKEGRNIKRIMNIPDYFLTDKSSRRERKKCLWDSEEHLKEREEIRDQYG